ncbi:interleukin-6 receptor subunit beta-like [Protopterus annectens]|uniref:interleukin-6 receptor subunit beta-like n=1 Tax=Protopterus annectens TaxID=7888 RepID=UPI001CF9FDD1|nr:interleukin-6 receptor subunit beta-like [Protopterus annectens]
MSVNSFNKLGPSRSRVLVIPSASHNEMRLLQNSFIRNNSVPFPWEDKKHTPRYKKYCIELHNLSEDTSHYHPCVRWNKLRTAIRGEMKGEIHYRVIVHGQKDMLLFTMGYTYICNLTKPKRHELLQVTVSNIRKTSAVIEWENHHSIECLEWSKYIIHVFDEQKNRTVIIDVLDESINSYHLTNLSAGHQYTVEVSKVAAHAQERLSSKVRFRTLKEDQEKLMWLIGCISLAILIVTICLAALCRFCISRLRKILWPPVPDPLDSKATQFNSADMKHDKGVQHRRLSSEEVQSLELLVVTPHEKKDADIPELDDTAAVTKELLNEEVMKTEGKEGLVCLDDDLPFEYRRQTNPSFADDIDESNETEFSEMIDIVGEEQVKKGNTKQIQISNEEDVRADEERCHLPLCALNSSGPINIKKLADLSAWYNSLTEQS